MFPVYSGSSRCTIPSLSHFPEMQQSLSPVDLRQATLESPYNGWRAFYQTRQASWLLCCPNAAPQVVSTNGERRPQNRILSISSRVMLSPVRS